jgi:hypothetical protein
MIKSKRMKCAGHTDAWEAGEIDTEFVGKPTRMKPVKRPRRRWENNIAKCVCV